MTTDEVLMHQFQAGSGQAFEELFERYRDPVHAFFSRRVWTLGRAEDLAQETWMAVLKATVRYQPNAPFRSYLYGIAFRVLANERRKAARQKSQVPEYLRIPSEEATFLVRNALEKLDATDREILMLREYEQLSYDEIAAVLRMPLNTVRSRLFRARLAMRALLEPRPESIAARGRL
jgi:RNA polymerase sigma-70 factor (ECF subfamily)